MAEAAPAPTTSGTSQTTTKGSRRPEAGPPVELGSRGDLHLSDRVVQRLTAAATREVDGVAVAADSGGSLGALGSALGRDYPRVDCEVAGNRVRASVQIAIVWPHPAHRVAAAVRDHVRDRLAELADLHADAVHVSVEKVVRAGSAAGTPGRRRVR